MGTVQTKLGHFVWHENQSSDVEAAKSFYSGLLGWEFEVFKPGEADYAMISAGGATHGGFWPAPPEGAPSAWLGHVYVADLRRCGRDGEGARRCGLARADGRP